MLSAISNDTVRYGWYVLLFPPRYHSKLIGNGKFRPSPITVGRYRSTLTVADRCRAVSIDFDRRRLISGDISRGREKKKRVKKRKNLEFGVALCTCDPSLARSVAHAIRHPRAISSPCARRRNVCPCEEKEQGDVDHFFVF
ncbi:hypothetical protein BHE74_00031024 [Ensete ventricosum]|nr:hypothetical protein BHE74_00031024 [Ensete ventricosum]